jgi:hypothetical protein
MEARDSVIVYPMQHVGEPSLRSTASAGWEAAVCRDNEQAIKRLAEGRAVRAGTVDRESASNAAIPGDAAQPT